MATFIYHGLATRQSRFFGISHKYITKTLTPYNYRWYAIVRDSCYLYIKKIKKTEDDKTSVEYRTYGWCWKDGREWALDYPELDYALEDLNTLNDGFEGVYPHEIETPWVTRTFFNSKNLQKDDKPFAYQFTGFGKEEKTVSNKNK